MHQRQAFTLIELLVVIAIIAILAVVVVLTLNPAELLRQSRDANRVSDMATLNNAINLYSSDQVGSSAYSLGGVSTTYLSLPSSATNCNTLGMATSAYPYACSTSANYRLASSSGWLPINFNLMSSGAPFGSVPIDPVNQTSSNLYYEYNTNGATYEVNAFPESQKYAKNAENEGGNDPVLLEGGSGMATLPDAGRGLVAYFPLNEGSGNMAIDWSGGGNNASWSGVASGTSGYYSPGKVWQWAGAFSGTNSYASTTIATATSTFNFAGPVTLSAWVYPTSDANYNAIIVKSPSSGLRSYSMYLQQGSLTNVYVAFGNQGGQPISISTPYILNAWNFLAVTANGATQDVYLNGQLVGSVAVSAVSATSSAALAIGYDAPANTYDFSGEISDARVYDRALSATEILEMYNAGE